MNFSITAVVRRLNSAKLASQQMLCLIEHTIFLLAFHHSWMQTQDTWTSLPALLILYQIAEKVGQDLSKDEVLFGRFGSADFHFCNVKKPANLNQLTMHFPIVTHSSIQLSFIVQRIHVNYEKEKWQNTHIRNTNTDTRWLWLFTIQTSTNFSLTVEWLNCHQQTHQCHTLAALSKACHEEPGHTPFLH